MWLVWRVSYKEQIIPKDNFIQFCNPSNIFVHTWLLLTCCMTEYAAAKTGEYLVILCNTQNFQIPTYNTSLWNLQFSLSWFFSLSATLWANKLSFLCIDNNTHFKFNFVLCNIRTEDDRRTLETKKVSFIFLNLLHICCFQDLLLQNP